MIRTRSQRATDLIIEKKDKEIEISHLKNAAAVNNYQPWILKLPSKKTKEKQQNTHDKNTNRKVIAISYVRDLSEHLVQKIQY